MGASREPSAHVFRAARARRLVWYAKYRLPDGRQVQKKIGPAWTDRGRPPAGYFTKRTAEAWLRDVLDQARRGTLPGLIRTGATFADAAAEYLRYAEHDRACKHSTLRDYRSTIAAHLLPAFGSMAVENIDAATIERWRAGLPSKLSPRTNHELLIQLHGIFRRAQKVYGLPRNPMAVVERHRQRSNGDIQVFSVEEVHALVSGGRIGAGRGDLPDRRVHRTSAGRAPRAPVARRGLRRLGNPGPRRATRRVR